MDTHILETLEADLNYYADYLHGFANEVLNSGVSKYPIFIAHKAPLPMGRILMDHAQVHTQWSISISLLEEFVGRNVVTKDKLFNFRQHFRDPETHMCVFVVSEDGEASFVFLPYDRTQEEGLLEALA